MTIISTASTTMSTAETKAFPPLDDTITWFKQVDWEDVKSRTRSGLNNVGLVVAVIGEKTYDFGAWLAKL